MSKRRWVILLVTFFLYGFAIWWLNMFSNILYFWDKFYTENTTAAFFCERAEMQMLIRQPINTFSNIVYWLVAVAILRRGWKDQSKQKKYNIISANPFYSITYGLIMLYTFLASTFFHSSLIEFASRLDYSAVYSLSLFPLMYSSHRVWLIEIGVPSNQKHPQSTRVLIAIFTTLYVLLTFVLPEGWGKYTVLAIIFFLLAFAIFVERRDPGKTNKNYLWVCFASILIAVMWYAFDVYEVLCDPNSFIQPHSMWHLFAGISSFYFYMYIRSEKNKLD